ncbi:CASP-like protein 4A1 [Pyrus x bretschneideri]|uniref:CASP-like protein 4A1 n=1 Tax=Pyrus x bretschneideri TaxID=225117 RepID=UPI00202FAE07|nr:CASP-like protein 4A1 [Pyrus x bretschneideri]
METVSDDQPETPPQHKEEEKHNEKQVQEEEEEEDDEEEAEKQSFPETPSPSPTPSSTHQTFLAYEITVAPADTKPASPQLAPPQSFRAEPKVVGPNSRDGFDGTTAVRGESGGRIGGGSGVNIPTLRPKLSILKRSRRESVVRRALFGLRISGFALCLISFSVMAADKNQGWALDSFYRYKEFRFCLAVNVIGFVYSGLQTYDLTYFFTSGKHVIQHHLRYYLDFLLDQILTYLLMSASSSAAIRVDDWESNWGKDKFPEMACASVALSFLAFVAFASSSLISGYTLCTLKSM